MPRREKAHDCALSSETAVVVRKRRMNPDGVEHKVGTHSNRAGVRNVYPWSALRDGDFFVVPIQGSEKAMRVAFQQAAARHDFEISIHPWNIESPDGPIPAFRVVRIIGGIAKIKAAARSRGAHAPSSDVQYFRRRQSAWARGEGLTTPPAMSIAPTPPPTAPVPIGTSPVAPLGADATARLDRAAMLREAQRRARMELAGLDPDEDEDLLGVGGNDGEAAL